MPERSRRRLHAQQVGLEVTGVAEEWPAERGCQPEFGARPLRRTIQTRHPQPGRHGHRGRQGRGADAEPETEVTREGGADVGRLTPVNEATHGRNPSWARHRRRRSR
ncbi:hypothetical protein [Streptomyces sp. NPDC001070]